MLTTTETTFSNKKSFEAIAEIRTSARINILGRRGELILEDNIDNRVDN